MEDSYGTCFFMNISLCSVSRASIHTFSLGPFWAIIFQNVFLVQLNLQYSLFEFSIEEGEIESHDQILVTATPMQLFNLYPIRMRKFELVTFDEWV